MHGRLELENDAVSLSGCKLQEWSLQGYKNTFSYAFDNSYHKYTRLVSGWKLIQHLKLESHHLKAVLEAARANVSVRRLPLGVESTPSFLRITHLD